MYIVMITLPLISSCSVGLFGRHFGAKGSSILSSTFLFLSFIFSLIIFYEVALIGCFVNIKLAIWITSDVLVVNWGFLFDTLTVLMCVIVTFISCLVHIYSTEYMSNDPHLPRFMSYLSLFTFFMLILVTADNFVQMFLGWEGVGLCSYLLINFWFTRIQANKAAIKAMIMNRIGDFSLLIVIVNIFLCYGSVDYATVFALTPYMNKKTIWFILGTKVQAQACICLFIFIGCVGKSAQLGLHTWLPDAMEGPTPVSALIHAATMVTAGVFLLSRCAIFFEYQNSLHINVRDLITLVGATTAFFASTVGLVQNDLK